LLALATAWNIKTAKDYIEALKRMEAEAGLRVPELCREL